MAILLFLGLVISTNVDSNWLALTILRSGRGL